MYRTLGGEKGRTMVDDRYRKIVLLHSNDLHGDFLAEEIDGELIGRQRLRMALLSAGIHRSSGPEGEP